MANERLIFLACNIYSILTEYSRHNCTFRWALWPMGLWFTRQLSKSAKTLQVVEPLIIIPPAFMPGGIQFSYFRLSICPFVCSFVRISFRRVRAKIYVRVSQVGYISPTTHQKTFIFGRSAVIPWLLIPWSMPQGGLEVKIYDTLKMFFLLFCYGNKKIVGQTWLNLVTLTWGHKINVCMTYISRSSDLALILKTIWCMNIIVWTS